MGRVKEIIKEMKGNDYRSFDEFYSMTSKLVYYVIAGIIKNKDSVEDLMNLEKDVNGLKSIREGFAVGRTIEKRYGFSVPDCDFNSGYKEFIDGNNQVTTEPITPEFNTQDGVSLQFYFLVGFLIFVSFFQRYIKRQPNEKI